MRFVFIKNEQVCNFCGSILSYGEEAVVVRLRYASGVMLPTFFHTDPCFEKWSSESYVSRLLSWRASAIRRPERKRKTKATFGRPKKYRNTILSRRLKASIYYHKKAGNEEKVEELEKKVEKIRIKR